MIDLLEATSPTDIQTVQELFREYEQFLQVDLCFQQFEAELAGLPGKYALPRGALLLATESGAAVGCVAIRPLGETVCEMKRLYIRPAYLGLGIGRRLATAVIDKARDAGYLHMVLDTLDKLKPALALYRSLGFAERPAYYENPLPGVIYMELNLSQRTSSVYGVKSANPPGAVVDPTAG
ncbi:MAG: GNAT family N-acetyltransferase [Proteobacteria bacterium]|nr:MAG: GNAT family N-acetyltransferase [Pseudomonadota bacterium]PIE66788.1 MAG: GNAT family N-acetyltransferase [Deltaproteobacteria bacterium]